ncbi:aromatic ring-hydroxylating dioxygenase subunit alpha [Spirulina sp. CS-785/01]|uniref:aromatic ring-hydroxylating dioxygenase subunit alpha n=1 Tax=Spirulina sp. CS-785/01 TaxID=3021716 RepID=UPI00232F137B|nr:aromatic ring-hydroxylating dioxygenase subunit alpha [Spirulina sp. CS-785/01]MDB9311879.1 aromatic ring-hydroxylating dioxygenase subunit alpha [Spirulina sp. CS-785/01]
MLVTRQPVLKRFWYPVMPLSYLSDRPQGFQLLGEKIVLWLDADGKPCAARDRCCHRSAALSLGSVNHGQITCPYHGWQFNSSGTCVKVPQLNDDTTIPKTYKIPTYLCTPRYGYAWVCLDNNPLKDIPHIAEADDPNFRLIQEFYEPWNCAGLRVMENELDLAHPTFVHTSTFGSEDHPIPDSLDIQDTDYGLHVQATLGVVNPEMQQKNLRMANRETTRTLDMDWFMPLTCKLRINYPNGLVHIIVNTPTPIDDSTSQIVQFCLRNDTEAETPITDVIAFDRQVTLEDKVILETTDYDVPLNLSKEEHMMTDKPGILIRRKMAALLKEQGEVEQVL